ncbi:MAG: hypothetical protein M1147_05015 [Nitrospirae bacterium]|nr:hypothetical protein [Nitrospirota bacterium]MCL5977479.1 hypothetical protein [Nitrospirota bacterium]
MAEPALNGGVEFFKRYPPLSEKPHQHFELTRKPQAVVFSQKPVRWKYPITDMVNAYMRRGNECLIRFSKEII